MPGLLEIDLNKRVLEGFPFSGPKAHVSQELYRGTCTILHLSWH